MVDSGIKQVIVKSADLPFIQFETIYNSVTARYEISDLYYAFRYRVMSEDKNRYSHWSPIQKIVMPDVTSPFPYTTAGRISVAITNNTGLKVATAVWTHKTASESPTEYEKVFSKINIFDVWVRWNNTNTDDPAAPGWTSWEYVSMVSSNSFSTAVSNGYSGMDIAIQVPTTDKVRDFNNNKLTLFRKTSKV